TATIRLSGSGTLNRPRAIFSGSKFHNGQIVGAMEPAPKNLTQEDLVKLVDAMRFKIMPVSAESGIYRGEFPPVVIPSITPERTTQILLVLQMDLEPQTAGEWEINVSIQPGTQTDYRHKLPPLRLAAVE